MPVKKAKKSRKQKGRGDYPPTFDEWYASPMSENAKYRVSIGDPSQLDEMRNWYLAKAGKKYDKPADIDETKYKVPKSKLGQFIEDNHVISKLAGGVIGFASNLVAPGSGALTGPAATYGLQQLGLGNNHRLRPTGKPPQHGSGTILYRTQPYPVKLKPMTGGSSPFLLANNSSYNSVKF
jgi:hypothetical protein